MFSNAKIFKRIEKEVFFLSKLYSLEFLVFVSLNIYLFTTKKLHYDFTFYLYDLLIFLAAIIFRFLISSFLHNCSHENTGGKILNYLIGEFCGAWVMYGYRNFVLIHILHHKYTDNHFDPVTPEGMTFVKFLLAPMRYMIKSATGFLDSKHSDKKNYKVAKNIQEIIFHLNLILRLVFWFLILGPKYFTIFYIPSVISNIFIFAHINYACHRNNEFGEVEIVNLDNNLYFQIANFITMGGYYHKNHHINQKLFNPTNLKTQRAGQKFISKEAKIGQIFIKIENNHSHSSRSVYKYLAIDTIWGERNKETIGEKIINSLSFLKTHP